MSEVSPLSRPPFRERIWPSSHPLFPPSTKEFYVLNSQLNDAHFAEIGHLTLIRDGQKKFKEDYFRAMANEKDM